MAVRPGDLLHGDLHGIQTIPLEIASKIAGIAEQMTQDERRIIGLCQSADFTLEKLRAEVSALSATRKNSRQA
jgi:regulator of RNase E activity RraA